LGKRFTITPGIRYLQILSAFFALPASGQKNAISYEQAFKNVPTGIFKPLPRLVSWIGDSKLVIEFPGADISLNRTSLVDIKNKQTSPYTIPGQNSAHISKSKSLPAEIKNYTLSPDNALAAYTYKNNLYVINISTGEISQMTFDGNDSVMNGYASWMYYEEILGKTGNYRAFWWSNDSKHLVFMRFDDSHVAVFPIYVSTDQYGYVEKQRYPKAGTPNPKVKIGIIDIEKKSVKWADFGDNDDQYFRTPYFTPGNQLWVQWVNRRQNILKLFQINVDNGSKLEIYSEQQDTWVSQTDGVYFIKGKDLFITKSDKTGWAHFYLYDMKGTFINTLTTGKYSVGQIIKFDTVTNGIYFTARKENSGRVDLYYSGLDGKNIRRISPGQYSYSNISISPGNDFFVASYSNVHTPAVMAVFDMQGRILMELGSAQGDHYNKYLLPKKEFKRVKSTDSRYDLPFIVTYPTNFDSRKKYPVVMSVYGGPYSTNVFDSWSLNLTDIWWAQEGIIQVIADNRSSGHFGKEGMNDIYQKAGKFEIEDFMAIGKWFKQQSWVDTAKLCITGFSHGGYMTCMGLTYGADVFNYGIAFWPVVDWHLYDTYYTERYMGMPQDNPEGYHSTSVLTYVSKYRGLLRIVHGTSDDNAHLQNTLQLVDTLQNLNKQFEFMVYPGSKHGLRGAKWQHNKTEVFRFYYQYLLKRKLPDVFLRYPVEPF
jgi:dipeptidyl-peptidase 4